LTSSRLAPSMAHSLRMPLASTATNHFQPTLARSTGLGPFPLRHTVPCSSIRRSRHVQDQGPRIGPIGVERFVSEIIDDAGIDRFVAARPQRGFGDFEVEDRFDVFSRRLCYQPDQNPARTRPVRNPWIVTSQPMAAAHGRQDRLDRRPAHLHHLRLQCTRHDHSASAALASLVAPGIRTGTIPRPVEGHLHALVLSPTRPATPCTPTMGHDFEVGKSTGWYSRICGSMCPAASSRHSTLESCSKNASLATTYEVASFGTAPCLRLPDQLVQNIKVPAHTQRGRAQRVRTAFLASVMSTRTPQGGCPQLPS